MVTVAVDANGADLGPAEVAAGAAQAAARGISVRLFGPAAELGSPAEGVEIVDAPVSIAKASDPAHAARRTPDASIVQAAKAVGAGEADALVSGGSTGSALAAGLFHMKRARGIYRPALALPLPIPDAPVLLLDVGANAEVRPEHLVQFAFMGAAFAEAVLGVARPRVGLLSNGEEPTKGTPDVIAVHEQLAAQRERLNFVGNVEGHGLTTGAADVVVTDGFTGNVALKILEGASGQMVQAIRSRAMRTTRGKLGGILLRPSLRALRDEIDPETPGGAYMLGLRRVGVVAHGRFTRRGFARAIEVAATAVEGDVVTKTYGALEAAGVLRTPSEAGATVPSP
jgi:phosphate acyltransferase